MNIELSNHEVEVLEQALISWESDACNGSQAAGFMHSLLGTKGMPEGMVKVMQSRVEEAKSEDGRRRRVSVLLRAKLIQALAQKSEHVL
jgi:hypothetical protein